MHCLRGSGWEMPSYLSLLPRVQPVRDPADLRAGCPALARQPADCFPALAEARQAHPPRCRAAGPAGHLGDSVSDPGPVETFGGDTVIEGVS
jgi:hypothetical protein